ncbi:MAG TPA: hypothetical protein PKY81_12425 [bacterium]|nr:hypothetical protein [bacterium]HPN31752.1 hypothetical protein [bacterium]
MEKIEKVNKTQSVKSINFKKNKNADKDASFYSNFKENIENQNLADDSGINFISENKSGLENHEERKESEEKHKSAKQKKNFSADIKKIVIAAERAIEKFNRIFDLSKNDFYMFYELSENNENITITVANSKTGEFIYKHTICASRINNENDFFKIIDDFLKDIGLLIDYQA